MINYVGTLPEVDQEYLSIQLNGHNYRANGNIPAGTPVSVGSAAIVGWTTVPDPNCGPANQQNVLCLSLLHGNPVTPGVGLSVLANPGVDGFQAGVWGVNVSGSNNGHDNSKGSLFGAEINLGLDDKAVDQPTLGNPGQSVGITVTESSQNRTGKRVTTAWGIGSAGPQNFHHGLSVAASPVAQTPMDDIVHATGPVTKCLDFSGVTQSGPVAVDMPSNGGLKLGVVSKAALPNAPAGVMYFCAELKKAIISTGNGYEVIQSVPLT